MVLPFWFEWGIPLGALTFAVASYAWIRYEGAKLDREYGKRD